MDTPPTTPALDELAELKRQRADLDARIAELTPAALAEGFAAQLKPEVIATRMGLSISRIYQLRRKEQ